MNRFKAFISAVLDRLVFIHLPADVKQARMNAYL